MAEYERTPRWPGAKWGDWIVRKFPVRSVLSAEELALLEAAARAGEQAGE